MKRMFVVTAAMSLLIVLISQLGCGDEGKQPMSPDYEGLKEDIDKQLEALQADIKGLQRSIAQGTPPPVIEGAIPVENKDPVEQVQGQTGGLPPSGEPTGKPVDDLFGGIPVIGEGRIVFNRNNGEGIYIMNDNGAGVELVVEPEGGFRHPALSPDKQHVAYIALGKDNDPVCFVRHIKSGAEFEINASGFPAWSPDGRQIALGGTDIHITTVDPVNPKVVKITHDGNSNETPTWSPDGKQIAYASSLDGNSNIFAIGVDGRNRIRLTNHPGPETHPDWSPDGEQIAFMGYRNNKTWEIYTVNVRTFIVTQVTDGTGSYVEPSWSPDGRKIAMGGGFGDIYVINVDGTGLTNLTNGEGGTSPDWQ